MGVTIASALAAPFTYGTSLAIPVSIYTGMNYQEQAEGEKDIGKAFGFGVLQAGLDLVGVKVGGKAISNFFTSSAARKEVIEQVAKQKGVSNSMAESMLVKAMRGNYSKGMDLTKAQLQAMVKTNPQIALGLGISVGASGVVEGVTEAAQESLSVIAAGGKLNWDDPDYRNRILNALAAGAVLGGGFGALESGTIADVNLKAGLADSKKKTQNQHSTEIDYDEFNKELSNQEAFEWTQNNTPVDEKATDKYQHESLNGRANQEFDQKDGFIDSAFSKARSLYSSYVEQELRPFQGKGKFVDRLISPFIGNRGGATIERERQLLHGQVADKAEFSERLAVSKLGFKNAQQFSEFHLDKTRNPFVSGIIGRATRSGRLASDLITDAERKQYGITPEYEKFLNQVAISNRKGNEIQFGNPEGPEFGEGFNVLDRGFSPQEIYNNQEDFTNDLVNLRNIPRSEAERIATILTNTEAIVEPEDIYGEITGTSDASRLKYQKALKGLKGDPRFSKYLENNVFNNIAQNGIKFSASHTNNKYFGSGGSKVAEAISRAVRNGDITEDESIKLARFFRDYQQQLSGTYNVVTNRTYNRAMNLGTTYASLNLLELAAISSFPEWATVLFHNNTNPQLLKSLFSASKQAGKEIATSVNELSTNLSGGHVPMNEYGDHREQLRKLGFLSEQTAPAARVGAEYSPNQARIMQMFFNAIQLNSSTNVGRLMALSQAEDAINSLVAQAAIHRPLQGETPNRFYTQAIREMQELGLPAEQIATMAYAANVTKQGGENVKAKLAEYMDIATLNYMDQRIMTPRKGNRAKWLNDPRFRILATFTGYISTATTTLLPKIFRNLGGKDSLPVERINSIQTIVMMLAMASLAISLKSYMRGGDDEEDKELTSKDYLRILSQSGLTGLFDRPAQILYPLSSPRTEVGELLGNVNNNLGDLANLLIGQSPIIENIDQGLLSAATSALDPKDDNASRNIVGSVPFLDIAAKERLTPYQLREK